MLVGHDPLVLREARLAAVAAVRSRLQAQSVTLGQAIRSRDLYFRVSLVGACNLSCAFCHNEGAPNRGKIRLSDFELAVRAAAAVGFSRIQLTGGEPLLRPDVADFVRVASAHSPDVGITTNGVYLPDRLHSLTETPLRRLHISLQTESLIDAGSAEEWGVPSFLDAAMAAAGAGSFAIRLNLPVPADSLGPAERFLRRLTREGADVKVFSVLPSRMPISDLVSRPPAAYPLGELEEMVNRLNAAGGSGRGAVQLRGFRPPAGIRCGSCRSRALCKEQSHSLRLGSDLVLRPCLATRDWDAPFDASDAEGCVTEAALLALDYRW